jgi:hypothetical protein
MFKLVYILLASCFLFIAPCEVFAKSNTEDSAFTGSVKTSLDKGGFISIGESTFSILFWDLYKSELLTTSGTYPVETDKSNLLFDIDYLADISSEDLIERTIGQWQHLGVMPEIYQRYLPTLKEIWPDIKKGDSLSLLIDEGRSLFYFNDKYIGAINSPEFGQIFIAIWLSEKTSQPDLRRELLGSITYE